ncbi:hypothetical protein QVD17_29574 [Tagetes erecta]|uniref:Protein kinase domain-containing protein n=1 Tax=Tagetes erecta TaxID=13708 RepID=A0AAD8NMP3_TARER|nr:hypothetical protein QVD17_29574 [Tagetes erecta]
MRKRLTTIQRFEICLGAARGLHYLHNGVDPIVHGNIKPSKILLNLDTNSSSKFVAKVSSFGLSKIVPGKKVVLDDEVRKVEWDDIYSFGVLLLQVLCGVLEIVDTDDYQERHVTELVPKKMAQNQELRKIVHRDIRKEIKTEALDTYAKIACQCVVEDPEARPKMDQVVQQLEKALRLQGGEVTYVEIPGIAQANVDAVDVGDGGENNSSMAMEDTNTNTSMESVLNRTLLIEDDKNESSNNDPETDKENLNAINSRQESNIIVENKEDNAIKIPAIKDVDKEISTNDPETTEEPMDDVDSNKKSKTNEENKEDDESIKTGTTSESSNGDTSTLLDQSFTVPVSSYNDVEIIPEDAEKENGDNINDTDNIKVDLKSYEESKIIGSENEANNESNKPTSLKSSHGNEGNFSMGGQVSDGHLLASSNGNGLPQVSDCDENSETRSSDITDENCKESVHNRNLIEDAKTENTNNDATTEKENLGDLNSKRELNITVEENKSKVRVKDANTTNDPEKTEEPIDDFESNNSSKIIEENEEDDDESMKNTTPSESSNVDTSTSSDQEVKNSEIFKSDKRNFSEVIEDELEQLRIPLEEIKFGRKVDVRGYGTMFEGEFNHQKVALKRLNITNLGNIKPKLLSAILTISRFRKHPNLVALIGFCDENNKEIILVYEHVSGGNLADKMSKHLTTIQRLQICLGAARGLEFLHSGIESVDSYPGIIHGHLKLSKILLNSNSISSEFEAKVSGFGLPRLLPGHVEIAPKSVDPLHAATGTLTKESDVYTFGVLLLEVLCGVPELVDTDDYQERHVTELVPKRLEQNMLRKIVHFDIRDEITDESLETYAKIACRCVMENPEERPTMTEVVEELEKALRLQGVKLSNVQIFGSSNGASVLEVPVGEDDHEGFDNGETTSLNVTEEESNDDINMLSGGNDVKSVPEDGEKENDPDGIVKSTETMGENQVNNESKITESDSNSVMNQEESNAQLLASSNDSGLPVSEEGNDKRENITEEEATDDIAMEDAEKENGNNMNVHETTEDDLKSNKEPKINDENKTIASSSLNSAMQEDATKEKENVLMMNTYNPHIKEITQEVHNIPEDNAKAEVVNSELIVTSREDFSYSASQTQKLESTSSDSGNGDPSDHLLPKSPDNLKKTSKESRYCCCCICSCWRFISDRIVLLRK